MTITGTVVNGAVVPDGGAKLPEGARMVMALADEVDPDECPDVPDETAEGPRTSRNPLPTVPIRLSHSLHHRQRHRSHPPNSIGGTGSVDRGGSVTVEVKKGFKVPTAPASA